MDPSATMVALLAIMKEVRHMAKGKAKARAKRAAKGRVAKTGAVWRMTAEEATLAHKPRYNGFACGHGAHGETKYSRAKAKRTWQKQLNREGASRGSFLYGVPPMPVVRKRGELRYNAEVSATGARLCALAPPPAPGSRLPRAVAPACRRLIPRRNARAASFAAAFATARGHHSPQRARKR